jgi:Mg/Co/Ni transporter MgtE
VLALFLPLILSSGGNSGRSDFLIIRAMAVQSSRCGIGGGFCAAN